MTEQKYTYTFHQIIPIINLKPKNNKNKETYDMYSKPKKVLLYYEGLFLYQKEGKTSYLPNFRLSGKKMNATIC